jgi:hypothetical protein
VGRPAAKYAVRSTNAQRAAAFCSAVSTIFICGVLDAACAPDVVVDDMSMNGGVALFCRTLGMPVGWWMLLDDIQPNICMWDEPLLSV